MTGEVKSYSPAHGYGFITADGIDYWFHISQWRAINAYPKVGLKVFFEPLVTSKWYRTAKIRLEEDLHE